MGRINFISSDYPYEWVKNNSDIVFISETHLVKGQVFKLKDYKDFHNSFSEYSSVKPRGGVSCFVKHNLLQYIENVSRNEEGIITIFFKNGSVIFGSYIPPSDSPYFDPADFSKLANKFTPIGNEQTVIGGGDINCRVGNGRLNLPEPGALYKHNVDEVINSHGRMLRKLCYSFKCFIVNNLVYAGKDFSSSYTFYKGNRKSQNDILLANKAGLSSLSKFELQNLGWNPSDHVPILATCELPFAKESAAKAASFDILSDHSLRLYRKAKKN